MLNSQVHRGRISSLFQKMFNDVYLK